MLLPFSTLEFLLIYWVLWLSLFSTEGIVDSIFLSFEYFGFSEIFSFYFEVCSLIGCFAPYSYKDYLFVKVLTSLDDKL